MALEKARWLALGGSPIAAAELTIEILCAKDPTVIIYKRRGPIPARVSGQISLEVPKLNNRWELEM